MLSLWADCPSAGAQSPHGMPHGSEEANANALLYREMRQALHDHETAVAAGSRTTARERAFFRCLYSVRRPAAPAAPTLLPPWTIPAAEPATATTSQPGVPAPACILPVHACLSCPPPPPLWPAHATQVTPETPRLPGCMQVLTQALEETNANMLTMRLAAGHNWYLKNRPRQRPTDADAAAALATSLSAMLDAAQQLPGSGSGAGRLSDGAQPAHGRPEGTWSCSEEPTPRGGAGAGPAGAASTGRWSSRCGGSDCHSTRCSLSLLAAP
jgi:hypothetical protein